jgi:lysyl endopeptidase
LSFGLVAAIDNIPKTALRRNNSFPGIFVNVELKILELYMNRVYELCEAGVFRVKHAISEKMVKRTICTISVTLLLVVGTLQLNAQVSYGGKPLMNEADFNAAKVLYLLPPEEPLLIDGMRKAAQNNYKKALEFATERAVDISPEYNGEWVVNGGTHVWRAHLISPEAYSLGVLFSDFALEDGARLFVYDPSGKHIKGAFTAGNNKAFGSLYVGHVPGEEVVIELQTNDPGRNYGKLRISMLSHAFLPVYAEENTGRKSTADTGLGTSQDCEIDINCVEGEEWQIIKRSVVHISTSRLLCTGALVNNTSYDGKPYVITAEHCIKTKFYAENSVFYFGYENSECFENDGRRNQSVSGSSLIATGDSIDFTLLKLSKIPPGEYNVYYTGWDVRKQGHMSAVTLHHPNGDAMKITVEMNPTIEPTELPGDLNDYLLKSNYRIAKWDIGTTEFGSSGSPLFNSSKKLIGILSGGLASCGDSIGYSPSTNRVIYSLSGNENDYFAKMHFAWDHYTAGTRQLKRWLDPVGTGQLVIGGMTSKTVEANDRLAAEGILQVYPNPARDAFTIELPEYTGKQIGIDLYDLAGRRVYSRFHTSVFPVGVEAAALPSGIYMIRISGADREITGRVVLE